MLAYLLALSVAVQASLIAFGAFALEHNIGNGPVSDARAHGLARLFFPVFVRLMRKEEARNMGYLKACLESGQAVQASSQS